MKRNTKREQWFATMEKALVTIAPQFAGRVPWNAATFHFNAGKSPGLAAAAIAASEQPEGLAWPHGATVKKGT